MLGDVAGSHVPPGSEKKMTPGVSVQKVRTPVFPGSVGTALAENVAKLPNEAYMYPFF